jgi:hypothetical protein
VVVVVVVVAVVVVAVVVVVVASGLRESSMVVGGVVWAVRLSRGLVISWGKSSRGVVAVLLGTVGSILGHHTALAVLVGLVKLPFHLDGGVHQGF